MKVISGILAVMVLTTAAAMAQAPKPPVVTEIQRLKLENANMKLTGLSQQYNQVDQEKTAVMAEIVKDNPGYHWIKDAQSGTESLVPVAAAPKAAVKATEKK